MPIVTNSTSKRGSLISEAPEASQPSPVVALVTRPSSYQDTTVDTRWTPRTNLLTHVEGSAWTIDYYSQVLDTDSQLSGQQLTVNAVYQSYSKVTGMEVRVTSPLATSQDEETKTMTLTGQATLYPFIIPNDGDMFVADLGEGKRGLFRVTSTVKKSIFKEACYEISYGLDTDLGEKIAALEAKVIKTVHFHKDFLNYGQNPLLVESDHLALLELDKVFYTLTQQYFKKFFSHEYKTLLVPSQTYSVYDAFLVDFLLSQFTTWDSPEIRHIRRLNVQDSAAMHCPSLWTALKEKDIAYLNTAFHKAGLVSTRVFSSNPLLEGIRYTGITSAVYPIDPALTVLEGELYRYGPWPYLSYPYEPFINSGLERLVQPLPAIGQLNQMVRGVNLQAVSPPPLTGIYPVTKDDYYVLSQAFYINSSAQSVLEGLVTSYLKGEAQDIAQLLATAKAYTQWGLLEQFYYVPIIMTLIRGVKRGM